MTARRLTLLDAAAARYQPPTRFTSENTGGTLAGHGWSVDWKRLQGGPADGIDLLLLHNGALELAILPTRGMSIWKAQCGELPLKWDSPVHLPVHPALVDQSRRGGIGWLDGFNELIVRCGLGWHGAPGTDVQRDADGNVLSEQFLSLHGRVANLPAHEVFVDLDDDGTLTVTGVVDESSLFGERLRLTSVLTTSVGSTSFGIQDTVTNLGGKPAESEMLYHCNFGSPLLGEGARLHVAASRVVPRDEHAAGDLDRWEQFSGPVAGYAEQCYFATPLTDANGNSLAVLESADGNAAVGIAFATKTLPWFTLWKNTQAVADGYCCGLEPSGSLPNNRQFEREQGRVRTLQPSESVTYRTQFEVAVAAEHVQAMTKAVQRLQEQQQRVTEASPSADLTPLD